MAGRGPQTFKKRQKEQQRKEKQLDKMNRKLQRKNEPRPEGDDSDIESDPALDAMRAEANDPDFDIAQVER